MEERKKESKKETTSFFLGGKETDATPNLPQTLAPIWQPSDADFNLF
jgi:hypothetical protein